MYQSKKPYLYGTGRRKSSVARVHLFPNGTGSITVNGRSIDEYFGLDTLKMLVRQPLEATGNTGKMDVVATVTGGGVSGQAGALRLGVISSVGSSLLPEWIQGFHAQNPAVRFELFEANTYQLLEQLHTNLLDLAIIRTPFEAKNLVSVPLCRETLLAVGEKRFFVEAGCVTDCISLTQLAMLPLILYRRWEKPLTEAAAQDGLTLSCFCLGDDARTAARLADCGLGVGVIPASSRSFLRNSRTEIHPLQDDRLVSSILAVHSQTARLSTVARLFLSYLQTQAEPDCSYSSSFSS